MKKIRSLLFIFILMILSVGINAQNLYSYEKAAIFVSNNKTQRTKEIYEKTKVKYWLYNSKVIGRGRIEKITDSSLTVKGKQIRFKDIRKIGIRKNGTIPILVVITALTPVAWFYTPLLFASVIMQNRNFSMEKGWKFDGVFIPPVDSARIKKIAKEDSLQNNPASMVNISLNPLNSLFNQHTLEISYQWKNKYSIGISGGIQTVGKWYHFIYDGTDDNYPTGVYKGWSMFCNFKKMNITRNHWYFETGLSYKYLYYDHVHFINSWGDPDPDIEWIRSEIANVFGIKVEMGKRIFLTNHILLEPVFGVSLRQRRRSYITYWANEQSEHISDNYWGLLFHRNQIFPGIQAGLLLTFGNFKLK